MSTFTTRRTHFSSLFADRQPSMDSLEPRQLLSSAPAFTALFAQENRSHSAVDVSLHHAAAPQSHTLPGRHRRRSSGSTPGYVNVSSDPLFSAGGPSVNDIRQGAAGDCWFLATLAEVALQDPSQIEQDIYQASDGTYHVYFNRNGSWTDVHVDGQLPATNGQLTYANLGQGNCTWVAIMEKAFTYFRNPNYASYTSINGGYPSEALSDLGLSDVGDYAASAWGSTTALGNAVYSDIYYGDGVELTTNSTTGPLVTNHVYSVESAGTDRYGNMMLEVRNPWGTGGPANDGVQWIYASQIIAQGVTVTVSQV